jgi:hypothetical protein
VPDETLQDDSDFRLVKDAIDAARKGPHDPDLGLAQLVAGLVQSDDGQLYTALEELLRSAL